MVDPDRRRGARSRGTALTLSITLIAVACGGGDGPSAVRADDDSTDSSGTDAAATADAADDSSETADSTTTLTSTTTSTTTTTPSISPAPATTLADMADLIVEWENAVDDPGTDPLDFAQRLIGFPLPLTVAPGATSYRLALDMFADAAAGVWRWEWTYSAFANGPVGDVDIGLDDKGAGTVELAATYDPIMAELGWRRTGTTTSDPGEPGGPNSVNHVYEYEGPPLVVDGAMATADPAFVWLDEDLIFDGEEQPGYRFGVDLEIEAGTIVVPLVESVVAALPGLADARLGRVDLSTFERPPDSFDAAEGLRYIELELQLVLPAGSEAAARTALSTQLDESVMRAARESFFDPGFYEPEEPAEFGDKWEQPILVLDRYGGAVEIPTVAAGDPVVVTVDMRFEANRELLGPVPG